MSGYKVERFVMSKGLKVFFMDFTDFIDSSFPSTLLPFHYTKRSQLNYYLNQILLCIHYRIDIFISLRRLA
jgi:hypothetical protein